MRAHTTRERDKAIRENKKPHKQQALQTTTHTVGRTCTVILGGLMSGLPANSNLWSLKTLNSKPNFTLFPLLLFLILFKVGWNPFICPACGWSDGEAEQMQETTSAGSVWHRCGKLHFPLLVLLSFSLSRRMTRLYIIKSGAHAPTSVTISASPACTTWLAEVVINQTLLNWPGVRINGRTEERFWPWTHPSLSNQTP